MSEQSHECKPPKQGNRGMFLCFGALAVALSIGFGYSMATLRYQAMAYQHAELAAKERASLHNRYMRQLNAADKRYFQLDAEYKALAHSRGKE